MQKGDGQCIVPHPSPHHSSKQQTAGEVGELHRQQVHWRNTPDNRLKCTLVLVIVAIVFLCAQSPKYLELESAGPVLKSKGMRPSKWSNLSIVCIEFQLVLWIISLCLCLLLWLLLVDQQITCGCWMKVEKMSNK